MTKDEDKAFANPMESTKTTCLREYDRISLRDYVLDTEIGAFQQERGKRQRIRFNVVIEVKPNEELDDDVDRILSYDCITEAISIELSQERFNLLETLATKIANRLLKKPQSMKVFIRLEKLDRGSGAMGIEIVRSVKDLKKSADFVDEIPSVRRLLLVTNSVINSKNLGDWINKITKNSYPCVLCVGLPEKLPTFSGCASTDNRIGLLAIEQNAWFLAARDKRCIVVNSKTEMESALKAREIVVWAPSKMILDSKSSPAYSFGDELILYHWLAKQIGSSYIELVSICDVNKNNFNIKRLEIAHHLI